MNIKGKSTALANTALPTSKAIMKKNRQLKYNLLMVRAETPPVTATTVIVSANKTRLRNKCDDTDSTQISH